METTVKPGKAVHAWAYTVQGKWDVDWTGKVIFPTPLSPPPLRPELMS
jgi:hypothetical protein